MLMNYDPSFATHDAALATVRRSTGSVLVLCESLHAAKVCAESMHMLTEKPVVMTYWNGSVSSGAEALIHTINRHNSGEDLVIVTVAASLPALNLKLQREIPNFCATYPCGEKVWSRLVAVCGKLSSPAKDCFNITAWNESQEQMEKLMKQQREAAFALAFHEVAQGVQQVYTGLLTTQEFFGFALRTLAHAPKLKVGDTDLVQNQVVSDQTPEQFATELDNSFKADNEAQ